MPRGARVSPDQDFGGWGGAVHQPGRRLTVGVLPQNGGFAVAIEVARADNVPSRSRVITDCGLASSGRPASTS
jgi:hypothetical protein